MNRFFEREVISLHREERDGTVMSVMSASSGEIEIIMMTHADDRERRGEHLAQRLLEALRDVVDVVGDPAQQVAAGLAVDVGEGQAVELVLDVAAQLATSSAARRRRG